MTAIYGSLFGGGRWEWDDNKRGIVFISLEKTAKKKKEKDPKEREKAASRRANLELKFVDTLAPKEMATFRHLFMRHVKVTDIDVITIQEIRNAVLYQCVKPLPLDIIDILHTQSVDNFLRALIIYMQQFLQVYDQMQRRHDMRRLKLTLGDLTHLERGWQRDLSDLRTLLAREHCALLLATEPGMERFHHLEAGLGGTTTSQGERDIRYYEILWRISARCVYIALERPSPGIILAEMNRLFRSPVFSRIGQAKGPVTRKKSGKNDSPESDGSTSHVPGTLKEYMKRVLHGPVEDEHNKFLTHSPAVLNALGHVDYRLMAVGQVEFGRDDERLRMLWDTISLPEEMMEPAGVVIGLLGKPRSDYDPMLAPLQKEEDEEQRGEVNLSSLLEPEKAEEEIPLRPGLNLPPPGPEVPAPSIYPQFPWLVPETIMAYRKMHNEEREKSCRRWRRWISSGAHRRSRRKLSPDEEAAARVAARPGPVTEAVEEIMDRIAAHATDEGPLSALDKMVYTATQAGPDAAIAVLTAVTETAATAAAIADHFEDVVAVNTIVQDLTDPE